MRVWIFICCLTLSACVAPSKPSEPTQPVATTNGHYTPHETDTTTKSVIYPIPDDQNPKGHVTITSLGVTDLKKEGAPNVDSTPVLHVRMSVVNHADPIGWDIDSRLLLVRINSLKSQPLDANGNLMPGQRPLFVNAKGPNLPFITVQQGEREAIDLFYALPEELHNADMIQNFVFDWQVATSEKIAHVASGFASIDMSPATISAGTEPNRDEYGTESTMTHPPEIGTVAPDPTSQRARPKVPVDGDKGWWQDPFGWTNSNGPTTR